jgi:hypothetical protein
MFGGVLKLSTILAVSTALISSHAEASENSTSEGWVACKKLKSFGLFEQCESIKVFKRVGKRVRAYSFKNKKLLNIPAEQVFQIRAAEDRDTNSGSIVLIPGKLLWGQRSSDQVSSICKTVKKSKSGLLDLNCGQPETRRVNSNLIYVLGSSYDEQFPLRKSAPAIIQTEKSDKTKG